MTIEYRQDKHDLGITDASGNLIGMMLVKKNNVPQYSVFDDEYLASQFFTGTPGYGNLPPEKELAMREDSHHAGFGQEVYDGNSPNRYFTSYNADLRSKNQAILSYAITALPLNSYTNIAPTGYVSPGTTWFNQARAHDVNISSQANTSTLTGWTDLLYFNHSPILANAVSYYYTLSGVSVVNTVNIGIYNSSAWVNLFEGAPGAVSTWITHTFEESGITNARIKFLANASATVYLAEFVFKGKEVPTCITEFNNNFYPAFGGVIGRLNTAGNDFERVYQFGAKVTDLESFTDNRCYIALGTANVYHYMSTAEAFTGCNNAVINQFTYLKTVHSSTPTMWGSDSNYNIRSTVNPANGGTAWSETTTVGSSYYDITELIQQTGALYIMKEDMPYYLNSTGAVQNDLAPELQALTKATSGQNVKLWLNKLYIPCGEQALLESDGGTNRWLNPADFITNEPDFNGRVEALAYDDRYLFAILNNVNTSVHVLAGRDETIDSVTDWRWHSIAQVNINGSREAYITSIYKKRLWIVPTNVVTDPFIHYMPLPTGYADVAHDANRNFQDGGYFITPKLHGNFKDTNKAFPELTVTMAHTYNANVYWEAHYKTDSNSTWTKIADYKGTSSSMVQTNYLPDAGSVHPVATSLTLKFVGRTSYTDITPILTSYKLNGILYPPQRTIIAGIIRCANDVLDKTGQIERGVRQSIITALDDARSATWPVSIRDIEGDTHTVKFLPLPRGTPRWMVVQDEKGREIERHYNVLMQIQSIAS